MMRDGVTLRPELPERVRGLPVHRGYPVPWFVSWRDGKDPADPGEGAPDFRLMDSHKLVEALRDRRCWVCGEKLGANLAFVIGPMCTVNRVSGEPPSHRGCAVFSARACPFLSRPNSRRRGNDMPEDISEPPGIFIRRNPGVAVVWGTRGFGITRIADEGILLRLDEPHWVEWYAEGRRATRAECEESLKTGEPALRKLCTDDRDHKQLDALVERAKTFLPV